MYFDLYCKSHANNIIIYVEDLTREMKQIVMTTKLNDTSNKDSNAPKKNIQIITNLEPMCK